MELNFVLIKHDDVKQLEKFLSLAGDSLISFRYFEKRPLSIINNHLITCILTRGDEPIAYGHLDNDGKTVWLGIAVVDAFKGKGIGNCMMEYLIEKARKSNLKILSLTVDKNNLQAIGLYNKFGFTYVKDVNSQSVLMQCNL